MQRPRRTHSRGVDFDLLRSGPITMFWRRDVLRETLIALQALGYESVEVDASATSSAQDVVTRIGEAFAFAPESGASLDALADHLLDVALWPKDEDGDPPGTVIVFWAFDRFVRTDATMAAAVLDVFASGAFDALVVGRRLLVLVQSDDPDLSFEPIGGRSPQWNRAEWMGSARHPERSSPDDDAPGDGF